MNHSPTITRPAVPNDHGSASPAGRRIADVMRLIDQSERATITINTWLSFDQEAQDTLLARLIAATLHDGLGTALETFAATGELNAEQALQELNKAHIPLEREGWVDALGRHILATGGRP